MQKILKKHDNHGSHKNMQPCFQWFLEGCKDSPCVRGLPKPSSSEKHHHPSPFISFVEWNLLCASAFLLCADCFYTQDVNLLKQSGITHISFIVLAAAPN